MARKKRIWYPGATYHVICRGAGGDCEKAAVVI